MIKWAKEPRAKASAYPTKSLETHFALLGITQTKKSIVV